LADTRSYRKRWSYQHPTTPGRLWKEIKADDSYSEYGYDNAGNFESITDFKGQTTTYAYDALNRLTNVTQPGGLLTIYDYDLHGNLASVTDAETHETTFTYDDLGQVVSTTSPDTGTTGYVYDEAGNAVEKTDAKGITSTYVYDALNRLTDVHFPDSSEDITYNFDQGVNAKGRLSGIADSSGVTAFGYDNRGRLVSKTSTVNGIDYTISRVYSPGSRVSTFAYPSGRTVNYTRYNTGRPQKITTTYGSTVAVLMNNLVYNPFGSPKVMDTGSGSSVDNRLDEDNLLKSVNPGKMLEQTNTYDPNGNLTGIQAPKTPWFNQSLTYDALNRLETATGVYGSMVYTYDNVGNRKTRTVDGATGTYVYQPGKNRLSEITGTNPVTFAHDANGNTTGYGSRTLVYNQNNRLIRVEDGASILGEYTYNALGQRMTKNVNGVVTVFHYDFDGNIIAESGSDGTFKKEYLYVGSNRLAMVDAVNNILYHYQNNNLGTPLLMTDSQGVVVWDAEYKPFGEANISSDWQVENNFRFAGQYFDQESELHYNYLRYYDPTIGRYLKTDPISLVGGNNMYSYVQNNPINAIDPYGLLRVHFCNTTHQQKEIFAAAFIILQHMVQTNEALRAYFQKFGIDLEYLLTSCEEGPDVYLGGTDTGVNANYNSITNNITIYSHRLNDTPIAIAGTLIHEIGHYANDIASLLGSLSPNLSGVPSFKNPDPSDGPYGFAAEIVTLERLYGR